MNDFRGGGLQKVMVTLAAGFAKRGHRTTLLTADASGPLRDAIPDAVEVAELERTSESLARVYPFAADPGAALELLRPVLLPRRGLPTLPCLPALARYLRQARPAGLIAASPQSNLAALWARALAGVPTRILASFHLTLREDAPSTRHWPRKHLPALMQRTLPAADAIVTVCDALADEMAATLRVPRDRIRTVYNPVVCAEMSRLAEAPPSHPWFAEGEPPVVLAAGRIAQQKDFATLVRAFARLRRQRLARLVILGEAKKSAKRASRISELQGLAATQGVAADVAFPGFTANPFAYMRRAAVFVLSSRYEGLGNVLIEAMACGCPVVSTDCPVGPAEILAGGRHGALVPIGDDGAMAAAIARTLDAPPSARALRERAAEFSVERAVDGYLAALFARDDAADAAPAAGAPRSVRSLSSRTLPLSSR